MTINQRVLRLLEEYEHQLPMLAHRAMKTGPVSIIDCSQGGLETGLMLARVCMADLADVTLVPGEMGLSVQVRSDDPVRACLASQYAGWQVTGEKYFAMGSGPMRAIAAREEIFKHIPGQETYHHAVGVLETKKAPPTDVIDSLMAKLPGVTNLTLLYAPAASLPGTIQVVARSLETALHKLHELKFDVTTIAAGHGIAPLPTVAKDELAAIGKTNDAILYGGHVTLWVKCDDAILDEIGPKVPSNSSKDHGQPFAELFKKYGDFYKIDPLLFSPAKVTFINLLSGTRRTFGEFRRELVDG